MLKVSHLKSLWLTVFLIIYSINARAQGAGNALYFDGSNDYVSVSNSIGTAHTIEFWIHSNTVIDGAGPWEPLMLFNGQSGFYLSINNSTSHFTDETISITTDGSGSKLLSSKTDMKEGWNHVAIVSNGSEYNKIFINGISTTVYNKANNLDPDVLNITSLKIGEYSSSYMYNGSMDEFRFWSLQRS